jgi:hypothetical protein
MSLNRVEDFSIADVGVFDLLSHTETKGGLEVRFHRNKTMGLILLLVVLVILFGRWLLCWPSISLLWRGPQPDTGDRNFGHSVQTLIVRAIELLRGSRVSLRTRRSCNGQPEARRSPNVETERFAFHGVVAGADGLDSSHHAAIALEQAVGDRHDARIRLGGARSAPHLPGNL